MKIAFVFTNYNNFKHSLNVVESISKFSNQFPIIIVDNMSNNDDIIQLNELQKLHKNLKVIYNEKNIGYFKGLNVGIEYLRNNIECDFIVIGNNDLTFPITFLEDFKKNHEILNIYAVVSPNIITLDNECQNPHVLNRISNLRNIIYDIYYMNYTISRIINLFANNFQKLFKRKDYLNSNIPSVIFQGYGACYILGPIFFKYYNQLFAPTFLMGEEFFLAYQLKLQNLKLYYEPSIKVYHQDHASTGLIESHKFWKISRESHKIYKKYFKSYE
jgi:GT2 family glycosyltransferase